MLDNSQMRNLIVSYMFIACSSYKIWDTWEEFDWSNVHLKFFINLSKVGGYLG